MNTTVKRAIIVFAAAIIALAFIAAGSRSYANGFFELDKGEIIFGGQTQPGEDVSEPVVVNIRARSSYIKDAVSDNTAIADVMEMDKQYFLVKPIDEGTCNLTVTGENGDVITIPVTVTPEWTKVELKQRTFITDAYYGKKSLIVHSFPGATGTVKIGKDEYEVKKISSKGWRKVSLKKVYKLKLKITVKMKYRGQTAKCTDKFTNATELKYAKVRKNKNKKRLYVYGTTLHKGDIVEVEYKGQTLFIKVKKNYALGKSHKMLFKFKNKFKKNSKVKISIFNKYNETLVEKTIKLDNWKWYY